jgi:hypothetical protein
MQRRYQMNRNALFTLIILISLCLPFTYGGCGGGGGSGDDGQVYVEEPFFFEVSVENHDQFRIQAIGGSLEITGSPTADSVTIEGERRVGSDSGSDAAAHLPELEVEVTDLGTEVFVETIQPKRAGGRNYVVDYRITIPENLEVFASQVGGSVFINSIDSQLLVNNISGDVELVEIVGSTQVNVVKGQIISQVTLPLDGSIELATINGSVDSEITLLSDGTIVHGSINLDIPQNTSATFAAGAIDGAIRLSKLVLQDEVKTPHTLTGTLGDGNGDIRLETDIGNITVTGF